MSGLIDAKLLAAAKATMKDRFQMMVDYYGEDTETYLKEIQAGIAAEDASMVMVAAHTIKSSSQMLGMTAVSELAKQMEYKARAMDEGQEATDISCFAPLLEQLRNLNKDSLEALQNL